MIRISSVRQALVDLVAGVPTVLLFLCTSTVPAHGDDPPTAATGSTALPRYRFQVGHELVYRLTKSEDLLEKKEEPDEPEPPESESEWRIYVARENDDGTWRLYIRRKYRSYSLTKDGKPKVNFENDFLGYVDLRSDGTYETNESLGYNALFQLHPGEIFFRLPPDRNAMQRGWEYDDPLGSDHYSFAATTPASGPLTFDAAVSSPEDANYQSTETDKYQFDVDRGRLVSRAREFKADWSINPWHSRSVIELVDQKQHDAAWVAAFAAAADEYLADDRRWWNTFRECDRSRSASDCKRLLNELTDHLQQRHNSATIPEFKELYAVRLALHKRDSKWAIEEADERADLFALDPVNWETTDLAGRPHRLVDYRGRIVVLDFWYRGCGHCIKALPKIKKLAEKYQGGDVVILGVNNDRNDSDAQFVIDTFDLRYPTLRAGSIPKKYGVNGWPTFIVLDQTGRIADYISGNSDQLYEQIVDVVDNLLAHPAQEPPARPNRALPIALGVAAGLIGAYFLLGARRSGHCSACRSSAPEGTQISDGA